MIDPNVRSILDSAQSPLTGEQLVLQLGGSYLQKIAKLYFEAGEDVDTKKINEELSRLSLSSSILADEIDDDMSSAFLIAEAAEISFDEILSESDEPQLLLISIAHILDIASFFHLADFDANANILAEKALLGLENPRLENIDGVSLAQVSYYKALGYYLRGKFGHLVNENAREIQALSTNDLVYLRLKYILVQLTLYYRGISDIPYETRDELAALREILIASDLYTDLSVETSRLANFLNVVKRKALYPLLVDIFPDQKRYLDLRINGVQDGAYPFAWPPVRDFCEKYLLSDNVHAVISLPTGAGKSFLAELAIISAIRQGWILYLAPTNALCGQIRNDLRENLTGVDNSDVNAIFGGLEYTVDLQNIQTAQNNVVVMTPEKASLFLKIYPDKAQNCSLVVLDEYHLLGERNRGNIAEFVLSSLITENTNIRIILMSALVSNGEAIANWLQSKTNNPALVFEGIWKPTRSSRILMLQDINKVTLEGKVYSVPIIAVTDLSNPWNDDDDYYFAWESGIELEDRNPRKLWNKNNIARLLAEKLANNNIKSLVVIFSNKHHVFSVANKMSPLTDGKINQSQDEFDWLEIAKYELGADSALSILISKKGVALHSSALIDAERKASEIAFQKDRAKVMVSTTTLSQGLNLKTQSVILAGTKFFSTEKDEEKLAEIDARALSQVLNASGRAARANVACRGFSILIPSENYEVPREFSKKEILTNLDFLGWRENSFEIRSRVEELVMDVQLESPNEFPPSPSEKELIGLLPFDDTKLASCLKNSFASTVMEGVQLDAAINRLTGIKNGNSIPSWVFQASSLANIDFEIINNLWFYIQENSLNETFSINDNYLSWSIFLLNGLKDMHPSRTWTFLKTHIKVWRWYRGDNKDPHLISNVESGDLNLDDELSLEILDTVWENLSEVISVWLMDGTILDLGNTLVRGKCPEKNQLARSTQEFPIPRAVTWSQTTIDELSRLAGALSALRDEWLKANPEDVPVWLRNASALQTLPMALRFGVNSPPALVWYRNTIQARRVANLLGEIIPTTIENPLDENQTKIFMRDSLRFMDANHQLVQEYPLLPIIQRIINNS